MRQSLFKSVWAKLNIGWFWASQILSVIGLAGIVDDLKFWSRQLAKIGRFLDEIAPLLGRCALEIATLFRGVVALWRSVFYPVFDLLFGWLPFHFPVLAKDAVLVVAFWFLGAVRTQAFWQSASDELGAVISKTLEKYTVSYYNRYKITAFNISSVIVRISGKRMSGAQSRGSKSMDEALGVDATDFSLEISKAPQFIKTRHRVLVANVVFMCVTTLTVSAFVALFFEICFEVIYWADDQRRAGVNLPHFGQLLGR